jgi:hypothetical protein
MEELKKIKGLQKEIKDLQDVNSSLLEQVSEVEEREEEALMKHYRIMFAGALQEGDVLKRGYNGFGIYRVDFDTSTYNKEIISVGLSSSSYRDDQATKLTTGFYSTSDSSRFEIMRMITIGRVGMIILDFEDDIIAGYNQIKAEFKDEIRYLKSAIYKNQDSISKCDLDITNMRRAEVMTLLNGDGIEFILEEQSYRNSKLEIRYDWDVRDVTKLEILSKTASGLSANIKVTRLTSVWREDDKGESIQTVIEEATTFDKVRMVNIESFVYDSKQRIKNTVLD